MKKKTSLLDVVKQAEADANPDKCEVKESGDECSLTYYGSKIETVEDLIKSAKIDLSIWEVVEKTVNNWEVAGKRRMGQNADKLWRRIGFGKPDSGKSKSSCDDWPPSQFRTPSPGF